MGAITWPASLAGAHVAAMSTATAGMVLIGLTTDQWGVIGGGLAIGILARSAYLLSMSKPVWRDFGISLLVAPMNGALAAQLATSFDLHDSRLLLATALLASSSTMAFMAARGQFLRWHGNHPTLPAQVFADPDTTTHVPKVKGGADVIAVGDDTPQTTGEVEQHELAEVPPETGSDARMERAMVKLFQIKGVGE